VLDQSLIHAATSHARRSVEERTPTTDHALCLVKNFLPAMAIKKLQEFVGRDNNHWATMERQETQPREKISWHSDSIVEELHEACDALTNVINVVYPDPVKNFWGISLWRDHPGYHIDWHQDNTDIDVAIQIYLFSHGPTPGTDFSINGKVLTVPFEPNTGYISCNSLGLSLPHRTSFAVPPGTVRYSLYAVWSRFLKHAPNS